MTTCVSSALEQCEKSNLSAQGRVHQVEESRLVRADQPESDTIADITDDTNRLSRFRHEVSLQETPPAGSSRRRGAAERQIDELLVSHRSPFRKKTVILPFGECF